MLSHLSTWMTYLNNVPKEHSDIRRSQLRVLSDIGVIQTKIEKVSSNGNFVDKSLVRLTRKPGPPVTFLQIKEI